MTAATVEALDLSDLDLLDDDHEHFQCEVCMPGGQQVIGIPYIAWCGRKAIRFHWIPKGVLPTNLCPDCARPGKCATCGTWDG